jgi:hypothetical protein
VKENDQKRKEAKRREPGLSEHQPTLLREALGRSLGCWTYFL